MYSKFQMSAFKCFMKIEHPCALLRELSRERSLSNSEELLPECSIDMKEALNEGNSSRSMCGNCSLHLVYCKLPQIRTT